MEREKRVLTVKELADELGISVNLAYRQVREKKIYSIKLGDRYLIPIKAFESLLSGVKDKSGGGFGGSVTSRPTEQVENTDSSSGQVIK
jgi:excisionase family DNA binding protein